MEEYALFSIKDFIQDLIGKINAAQKRIYIQAMIIELEGDLTYLTDALCKARKRGVEVILEADWYMRMVTDEHINYIPVLNTKHRNELRVVKQTSRKAFNQLKQAGASIIFTNKPIPVIGYMIPFMKRNHIKLYIIDDVAFIGGTNLAPRAIDNLDFMIRFSNKEFVTIISEIFFQVNKKTPKKDVIIPFDQYTTIYLDHGKMGESGIYKEAMCEIALAKKSIDFVSQYIPDFSLLQKLKQAKRRGIAVQITSFSPTEYNQSERINMANKPFIRFVEHLLFHLANSDLSITTYTKKVIHAKLLIIDKDSNTRVFFSSHNFSKFGVFFGTNEIGIKTTHPELVSLINEWYRKELNG